MATSKKDKQHAIERLHEILKPGDKVYTILRHVSKSGMNRCIDLYAFKNEPGEAEPVKYRLTGYVCDACGYTYDRKHESLKIGGCGMDMGFAVVYDLSYVLWPSGYGCIGEKCPSNDHHNGDPKGYQRHGHHPAVYTGTTPEARKAEDEHWHKDGGYCLRQEWIG